MLFNLHKTGKGKIPEGYGDIYLCDLLNLTYTQLYAQPYDWVYKMQLWKEQKYKAEEARTKEQELRQKKSGHRKIY